MELKGKKVVVIGLGTSGVAAARLCLRRGAHVIANDLKPEADLDAKARALRDQGAEVVAGRHVANELSFADLVVVSPGVPTFVALEAAERAGVRVIGEVELSVNCLREQTPIVVVGGTNGKSTTTSLVGSMFEAQGRRTFTGGNLGEPLAEHVDETFEVIVLEVSSFQLERVKTLRPKVSVLLNITEDHLDRYPDFAAYANTKGNAFAHQTALESAVVPASDPECLRQARRGEGLVVTFGKGGDVDVRDDVIVDSRTGELFARSEIALKGGHNALNAAAAIAAATAMGASPSAIRRALATFRGLPHRMALVRDLRGVHYYDDSKGTNVGAVVTALVGLDEPKAVLIAGGRDKGGSYSPLADVLTRKGRAAVLIGEAAPAIEVALRDVIPVRRASSLEEAVKISQELALPGDAVLLSPACSSYDMFRDYKHRGDEFVRAVQALSNIAPDKAGERGTHDPSEERT